MRGSDVTGVVLDGADVDRDIDYQLDSGTVTATFRGFESQTHGLVLFEVCVGSRPGWDDVVPYSSEGIIVEDSGDTG